MDAHLGTRQSFRDGVARLQLLWDLRRAIDDRLLTLVYQPQFEMGSGAVCGAEALLRWEHATLGTLEPREFLPLVREHGLMDAVTDMVLWRAVADASGWHQAGTAIPVAINLWARSLDDATLPDRIMSVLDAHGMSRQPADSGDHRGTGGGRLRQGPRCAQSSAGGRYPGVDRRLRQRLLHSHVFARVAGRRGQTRPPTHRADPLRPTRRDDRAVRHRAGRGVRHGQVAEGVENEERRSGSGDSAATSSRAITSAAVAGRRNSPVPSVPTRKSRSAV